MVVVGGSWAAQEGKNRGAGPRPEEKRSSAQEGNRRFSDLPFQDFGWNFKEEFGMNLKGFEGDPKEGQK